MRNAFLLALVLAAARPGLRGEEMQAKGAVPQFPRIVVNAQINDQPVRFLVDTGMPHFILFRPAADRLNLKVTDPASDYSPTAGAVKMMVSEECQLRMGEGRTWKTRLGVIDALRSADADGTIGWAELRKSILAFDPNKMNFERLEALPDYVQKWKSLKIDEHDDRLAVLMHENEGENKAVLIDTGDPRVIGLSPARWDAWCKAHPSGPATVEAVVTPAMASGLSVLQVHWADSVELGPLSLEGVSISEVPPEVGTRYTATLGLLAVSRLAMVIDGPGNVVYVQPRETFAWRYDYNRLGAVFAPTDLQSDPLLAHVVENGPAWRAGVRPGDELLKIGDLDATKWRTDPQVLPLTRFWEQPAGTELHLTLRRDGKPFDVSVTLEEIFPESVKYNPKPGKQ